MGGKKVFISVKYNHDHLIERSLSASFKEKGLSTYFHEGTIDILKKGALPPIISQQGGLTIGMPTLSTERQVRPQKFIPKLVKHLVRQVCRHDLVIVIWSTPYKESFWTMLELKAAQNAKKPMIIIQTDDEPLPQDLNYIDLIPVIDIDIEYKTSRIVSLASEMLLKPYNTNNFKQVHESLQRFVEHQNEASFHPSLFSPAELEHYKEIFLQLLRADVQGNLHKEICLLNELQMLDDDFRKYMEYVIGGSIEPEYEDWYYTYLLGEILDVKFLNPIIPPKLKLLFEQKIYAALNPPKQTRVESLIEEMIAEHLYSREFIEYFGNQLNNTKKEHGLTVASIYWEICTSQGEHMV